MESKERLVAYLNAADPHSNWMVGNRHIMCVSLASSLNRAGHPLPDVILELTTRYTQPGFDEKEIEDTVRDIYQRYASDHGINEKKNVTKRDKGTKGQKDISAECEEDEDEDEILKAECPDIEGLLKYIPDYFRKYFLPKNGNKEQKLSCFIAFLVSAGAQFKNILCVIREKEIARGNLYLLVMGPAAAGKSVIIPAVQLFWIHGEEIKRKSQEDVQKQKEAHKKWDKCVKSCEEEDCGCGVEPIIPKDIRVNLTPNISASKCIHQLEANGDISSLMSSTELDSNLNLKEQPLSPILRATYEGEPIASNTHAHGETTVKHARMSMVVASTEDQCIRFIGNKLDGLASRFLNIYLTDTSYKKLSDEQFTDYDDLNAQQEAFKNRALTFSYWTENASLRFKLSKESKELIDSYIMDAERKYASFGSDELTSFLRRLVRMDVNLAMITASFKLYEENISTGTHYIPNDIVEKIVSLNDFFVENHIRFLASFPQEKEESKGTELVMHSIFKQLPCYFTSGEALELAKEKNINKRTFTRNLKKMTQKGLLEHPTHGVYIKTDCKQSPEKQA